MTNDHGLHVRVGFVEAKQPKQSLVILTSKPVEVLRFLDLDMDEYRAEQTKVKGMFTFLAPHEGVLAARSRGRRAKVERAELRPQPTGGAAGNPGPVWQMGRVRCEGGGVDGDDQAPPEAEARADED
ncbi:hypothetical protein MMC07_007936 [Pseudocyphellaria aurata]|nr:hypothetical protein [Pseudocyphellaria aurata]